ncbi:MAG: TraB/GumN family protein [Bacteroidales bacterium]|nr:TraB/GumN family protein [Bacteroidales bacterium]
MRKRLKYPLLLLVVVYSIAFCSIQPKLENSLLWKISGNGLTEDSYLFGTNHGVHNSFLDSVPGFWNAFLSAKTIVVELDVTSQSNRHSFVEVLNKEEILLPKDSTYKVLYNTEDYKLVDDYMNAHGFGHLSGIDAKPALMNMVISFMMLNGATQKVNNKSEMNMEPYMLNLAKKTNKNIMQLDDLEKVEPGKAWALEWGLTTPLKEQADALLELIKNEDTMLEARSMFAHYYKQQDLEIMDELNDLYKKTAPKTYDMRHVNRNDIWMESILEILKSGSSFIAVGVRHLVGEDGLIALLRKEGYTVEPIKQ